MPETEFLVLRLYGPLAAWGDIACGEVRPTLIHPTKSAIIGLLGAALGVRRSEEDKISKMRDSYGFAVSEEGRCVNIRDYHTVQSGDNPIITYRDYLCDVIYTVAVWIKDDKDVPYPLKEIEAALKEPKFVPYLGRKSCVLSRPMEPQRITKSDPASAIKEAKFYGDTEKHASKGKLYVYNRDYESNSDDLRGQLIYEGDWDIKALSTEIYRDEPISRERWQFKPRRVKRTSFVRRSA